MILTCSRLEVPTVDTMEGRAVEVEVEVDPCRAEGVVWTTLVTVMVCLWVFAAEGLVTTIVPSGGN